MLTYKQGSVFWKAEKVEFLVSKLRKRNVSSLQLICPSRLYSTLVVCMYILSKYKTMTWQQWWATVAHRSSQNEVVAKSRKCYPNFSWTFIKSQNYQQNITGTWFKETSVLWIVYACPFVYCIFVAVYFISSEWSLFGTVLGALQVRVFCRCHWVRSPKS